MWQDKTVWAVFVCAAVLFGANIWGYDLWPPDEPRFAEVAREMLQSGDWLVPRVNGEPYKEKPPLLFWSIAVASLPFGDVTAGSARSVSVASGLAMTVVTYLLASRLFGKRVGLWSAVVLMTSTRVWWQARTAQTDMLLAALLTAALLAFWLWHESRRTHILLVFYAAIAAAVYAKGPPGLVFPLLMAIIFFWGQREERRSAHLALGALAVAGLIALWLIPARMAVSGETVAATTTQTSQAGAFTDILYNVFYRQIIGRFFLGVSKAQPPWYYLTTLPVDLFPWTIFLPWTLIHAWRNRKEGAAMRLLLSWIIPAFIFFSICSGKRQLYLLPLYPAFAILIARGMLDLMTKQESETRTRTWLRRLAVWSWGPLLIAFACAPLLKRFTPYADVPFDTGSGAARVVPVMACAAAFGLYALGKAAFDRKWQVHKTMALQFGVLLALCPFVLFPILNTFKSAKDFCKPVRVLAEDNKDFDLYSVAFSREEYVFYSKHFHTRVLMDEFDAALPGVDDPEKAKDLQRVLAAGLVFAVEAVPIATFENVTEQEAQSLRAAVDGVFAGAREQSTLVQTFESLLENEVGKFATTFLSQRPAFAYVQQRDWRWLLGLAPELRTCNAVRVDSVGSRDMLLVANTSGLQLLKEDPSVGAVVSSVPAALSTTAITAVHGLNSVHSVRNVHPMTTEDLHSPLPFL